MCVCVCREREKREEEVLARVLILFVVNRSRSIDRVNRLGGGGVKKKTKA